MIGESGVGKSTLVGRLCEDRFLPDHRQYTLGMCAACAYACSGGGGGGGGGGGNRTFCTTGMCLCKSVVGGGGNILYHLLKSPDMVASIVRCSLCPPSWCSLSVPFTV